MSIAAEAAIRAWVNSKTALVGAGRPLSNGAYLRQQRSPDSGAYLVLARVPGGQDLVAEQDPGALDTARIAASIYAGTEEAAENAAAAYATAVQDLTGNPEPCPGTGVRVLVSDNVTAPAYVPQPADTGEPYCFTVTADFVLAQY